MKYGTSHANLFLECHFLSTTDSDGSIWLETLDVDVVASNNLLVYSLVSCTGIRDS